VYYILFKKNIKLLPAKVASEVRTLSHEAKLTAEDKVIVLGVSTTKFKQYKEQYPDAVLRKDPTNIVAGKAVTTCMIFKTKDGLKVKL